MMKHLVDLNHLKSNNESYFSHLAFALTIGLRLGCVASFFVIHSIVPWISVPKNLNLEETGYKIQMWNQYADGRKKRNHDE